MRVYCVWIDGRAMFSTEKLAKEYAKKVKEDEVVDSMEIDERVNWVNRTYWAVAMNVQSGERPAVYERERVADPDIDEARPLIGIKNAHLGIEYLTEKEFMSRPIDIDNNTTVQTASYKSADHAEKQAMELRQRILEGKLPTSERLAINHVVTVEEAEELLSLCPEEPVLAEKACNLRSRGLSQELAVRIMREALFILRYLASNEFWTHL